MADQSGEPIRIGDIVYMSMSRTDAKTGPQMFFLNAGGALDLAVTVAAEWCSENLFEICTRAHVTSTEEYMEWMQLNPNGTADPRTPQTDKEKDMQDALIRVMTREQERNSVNMEDMSGRPVFFGDIIQLRHVASNTYVTVPRQRAAWMPGIQLSKNVSSLSWFQFSPSTKLYAMGDQVVSGSECFLEIAGDNSGEFVFAGTHVKTLSELRPLYGHRGGAALEPCLGLNKTAWTLSLFTPHSKIKEEIAMEEFVYLHDPELDVYLALGAQEAEGGGEAAPCFHYTRNSNALWALELVDPAAGGQMVITADGEPVKHVLRHLNTGRYLSQGESLGEGGRFAVGSAGERASPEAVAAADVNAAMVGAVARPSTQLLVSVEAVNSASGNTVCHNDALWVMSGELTLASCKAAPKNSADGADPSHGELVPIPACFMKRQRGAAAAAAAAQAAAAAANLDVDGSAATKVNVVNVVGDAAATPIALRIAKFSQMAEYTPQLKADCRLGIDAVHSMRPALAVLQGDSAGGAPLEGGGRGRLRSHRGRAGLCRRRGQDAGVEDAELHAAGADAQAALAGEGAGRSAGAGRELDGRARRREESRGRGRRRSWTAGDPPGHGARAGRARAHARRAAARGGSVAVGGRRGSGGGGGGFGRGRGCARGAAEVGGRGVCAEA